MSCGQNIEKKAVLVPGTQYSVTKTSTQYAVLGTQFKADSIALMMAVCRKEKLG